MAGFGKDRHANRSLSHQFFCIEIFNAGINSFLRELSLVEGEAANPSLVSVSEI